MPYFFKLPTITELTIGQQAALNEINAIAISGGPGTGKSVVSLWRHIRNYGMGTKRSLLLTYSKTLEIYLTASAKSESINAGKAIDRTYWWTTYNLAKYDEIIVDEAQDVENNRYNTIKNYTSVVSYGADDQQILYKNKASTQKQLESIFPNNRSYILDENFRNSYEILLFVKALFPDKLISQITLNNLLLEGKISNKPMLLVSNNDYLKQTKAIIEIINQFKSESHNIAILVPFQEDVVVFASILRNNEIECSSFSTKDEILIEIDNVHVTTFKSAKGTEFDTVIIPNFERMIMNTKNYNVIDENDYYVGITRAKRNLYLISDSIPYFLMRSEQQKLTYSIENL